LTTATGSDHSHEPPFFPFSNLRLSGEVGRHEKEMDDRISTAGSCSLRPCLKHSEAGALGATSWIHAWHSCLDPSISVDKHPSFAFRRYRTGLSFDLSQSLLTVSYFLYTFIDHPVNPSPSLTTICRSEKYGLAHQPPLKSVPSPIPRSPLRWILLSTTSLDGSLR